MQAIDTKTLTEEYIGAQAARVEQLTLEALHAQYMRDQSPNKGTEEDYLERKLADGWRRSSDGQGIWRLIDRTGGGLTNSPDPSLYESRRVVNQEPAPPEPKLAVQDVLVEKKQPLEAANAPAVKRSWIPKS